MQCYMFLHAASLGKHFYGPTHRQKKLLPRPWAHVPQLPLAEIRRLQIVLHISETFHLAACLAAAPAD